MRGHALLHGPSAVVARRASTRLCGGHRSDTRAQSMVSAVRPGDLVAGYRLERLIGRGGMAVVYRAEHVHLRRSVALKIPAADVAADPAFRERFIRESRIAASIAHPNLVTIFDAGE